MQARALAFSTALLAAAAATSACSGAPVRVDRSERIVHARGGDSTGGRYELRYQYGPVPPSWEPITIEGNDLAWHDSASDGVVHVDHSCGRNQDTPLTALVQHLLIGFTDREFVSEETVPFDGREARHVVVRARLDGVPVTLELWVMKKDGCVYDLGYVAPPDRFERGAAGFAAFVRGFRTTTVDGPIGASRGGGP